MTLILKKSVNSDVVILEDKENVESQRNWALPC
jgi:hypothetical protein